MIVGISIVSLIFVTFFFIKVMTSYNIQDRHKYTFWQAVATLGVIITGFIVHPYGLIYIINSILVFFMFIQSRSYIPRLWEWIQWHTWYKLLSERPKKFDKYDKNK